MFVYLLYHVILSFPMEWKYLNPAETKNTRPELHPQVLGKVANFVIKCIGHLEEGLIEKKKSGNKESHPKKKKRITYGFLP